MERTSWIWPAAWNRRRSAPTSPYIIAVQLPRSVVEDTSGAKLTPVVLEALHYILHRADDIAALENTTPIAGRRQPELRIDRRTARRIGAAGSGDRSADRIARPGAASRRGSYGQRLSRALSYRVSPAEAGGAESDDRGAQVAGAARRSRRQLDGNLAAVSDHGAAADGRSFGSRRRRRDESMDRARRQLAMAFAWKCALLHELPDRSARQPAADRADHGADRCAGSGAHSGRAFRDLAGRGQVQRCADRRCMPGFSAATRRSAIRCAAASRASITPTTCASIGLER